MGAEIAHAAAPGATKAVRWIHEQRRLPLLPVSMSKGCNRRRVGEDGGRGGPPSCRGHDRTRPVQRQTCLRRHSLLYRHWSRTQTGVNGCGRARDASIQASEASVVGPCLLPAVATVTVLVRNGRSSKLRHIYIASFGRASQFSNEHVWPSVAQSL